MRNLTKVLSSTVLLAVLHSPELASAQSTLIPCVNSSTGKVSIRTRCQTGVDSEFRRSSYSNADTVISSLITSNTNNIATNTSAIASAATTIAGIASTLTSQASAIASNTADLSTISSASTSLSSSVPARTSTLASHTAALAQLTPASTFTVATSGAQYTSIQSAVSAADSAGVTTTTPGIIVIAPGIYDLTSTLTVIPGLTIRGSGIDRTIIRGDIASTAIEMSNSSALENLSLRKTAGSTPKFVNLNAVTDVAFRNVKFDVSNASNLAALWVQNSSATLDSVQVVHSCTSTPCGAGVLNTRDSTLSARGLRMVVTCVNSCAPIYAGDGGTADLYDSDIQVTETGYSVAGIQASDTVSINIVNSNLVANSTGGYGSEAIYSTSAGTISVKRSSISCSGTNSGQSCLHNASGGTLLAEDSSIDVVAGLRTVGTGSTGVTKLVRSILIGGPTSVDSGGTSSCAGVTDTAYTFYTSTCP